MCSKIHLRTNIQIICFRNQFLCIPGFCTCGRSEACQNAVSSQNDGTLAAARHAVLKKKPKAFEHIKAMEDGSTTMF